MFVFCPFASPRGAAAEASRRERDKVSSALLLWKLHTQGKAFAALAAHRLRRYAFLTNNLFMTFTLPKTWVYCRLGVNMVVFVWGCWLVMKGKVFGVLPLL